MDCLFAYGTLLAPELRTAIIGREVNGETAELADFACYRVKRAPYPAIVEESGARTQGQIFRTIVAGEWRLLDAYESKLYQRLKVNVQLLGGRTVTADTYVIVPSARQRLSADVWDYGDFRQRFLFRYLNRIESVHRR